MRKNQKHVSINRWENRNLNTIRVTLIDKAFALHKCFQGIATETFDRNLQFISSLRATRTHRVFVRIINPQSRLLVMKRRNFHLNAARALLQVVFLRVWRGSVVLFSQIVRGFRVDMLEVSSLHVAKGRMNEKEFKECSNGFGLREAK